MTTKPKPLDETHPMRWLIGWFGLEVADSMIEQIAAGGSLILWSMIPLRMSVAQRKKLRDIHPSTLRKL